jgi:uncharacterized protein DUF4269
MLALAEWKQLKLGERLASYDPVAVSSMLTGLNVGVSDLDVVCDLRQAGFLEVVRARFAERPSFETWRAGSRTVVSFEGTRLRIELVGEERAVEEQPAYLHAVAHRRLVDLGGERFARSVRRARRERGCKTELAIALVLGLHGDPYVEVMRLAGATEQELTALIRAGLRSSGAEPVDASDGADAHTALIKHWRHC